MGFLIPREEGRGVGRIASNAQSTQYHIVGKWIRSSLIVFSAITDLSFAFGFTTRRVSGLLGTEPGM